MQKVNLLILTFIIFCQIQAQNNVRLVKKTTITNGITHVTEYSYAPNGKINNITETQNNRLLFAHYNFIFNSKGLLISYNSKTGIKTFPTTTNITYNDSNTIKTFEVRKNQGFVPSLKKYTYTYNVDTVKVIEQTFARKTTFYIYNIDSNIVKIQSSTNSIFKNNNTITQYDYSKNPMLMLGGFVSEIPISKNNCLVQNETNNVTINRKMEYQQILVHKYKATDAKIPTQYKNGSLLKCTENIIDNTNQTTTLLTITTYEYSNL